MAREPGAYCPHCHKLMAYNHPRDIWHCPFCHIDVTHACAEDLGPQGLPSTGELRT